MYSSLSLGAAWCSFVMAIAMSANVGLGGETKLRPLVEAEPVDSAQRWLAINDNVMGGVSQGSVERTAAGTLLFSGTLSLENRGGFSSIQTRPAPIDLSNAPALVARIRGDGRSYWMDLRTSTRFPAFSYRLPFETRAGEWQELRLPLADFKPQAFGQNLPLAQPLNPANVQSIGFTIADKKAGPFKLEIAWIRADAATATGAAAAQGDLLAVAESAGKFKTLLAAVKAAGLESSLHGDGPFTVFAPTDEAFAKLPANALDSLLKPENREQLVALLKHHVVNGRVSLGKALDAGEAATLDGEKLKIAFADGRVRVDKATLVSADIAAVNGVIHVVDSVLLPEAPAAPLNAQGLIGLAINRGVPLFNAGQPEACASIYEVTAQALLAMPGDALGDSARQTLRTALTQSQSAPSQRERAWILRRALDSIAGAVAQSK